MVYLKEIWYYNAVQLHSKLRFDSFNALQLYSIKQLELLLVACHYLVNMPVVAVQVWIDGAFPPEY